MANSVPSAGGFMVVTHVAPPEGGQRSASQESRVVSTPHSLLGKFLKGEPVALGTIQIMIGVVVFLFGIVTAFHTSAPSAYAGVMFWGATIYITAGSLTVRANKKLNPCLVKASMGMNILSTVSAGIAMILHTFDLLSTQYSYSYVFDCYGDSYDSYSCMYPGMQETFMHGVMGIAGVMLVLSILEFIVSICVSAFACKATCSSGTEQVIYVSSQVPSSVSTIQVSAPPLNLNPSEMPPLQSSAVPPAQCSSVDGPKAGISNYPPEYTATQ